MIKPQYSLDNDWVQARERLALLERSLDPRTLEAMEEIGVGTGWRALVVGAGGGSVVEWLCVRVAPEGRVVATDINTRFLDALEFPNLEVWKHDAVSDAFPAAAFDLVEARLVLFHLPEREAVLAKLAQAVRPGGWLLVEEPDFVTRAADPLAPEPVTRLYQKLMLGVQRAMAVRGGLTYDFGARLPGLMRRLGFEALRGEGRAPVVQGGSPDAAFMKLSYQQLRAAVLAHGEVSEREYDDFLALHDDPDFLWRWYLVVSVWGRREEE